ncbi:MAG TPA: hypothetical protein VIJ25_15450, partial [Methylococcales bacterium]
KAVITAYFSARAIGTFTEVGMMQFLNYWRYLHSVIEIIIRSLYSAKLTQGLVMPLDSDTCLSKFTLCLSAVAHRARV